MLLPHFSLIMSFWRVVPLLGVAFFSKWEVFTRSSHAVLYYTGTWHKPLNFLASWCKPEKIRGASRAQTHVPKPESQRLTRLSFVAVIPDISLSSRYVTAVCQDILLNIVICIWSRGGGPDLRTPSSNETGLRPTTIQFASNCSLDTTYNRFTVPQPCTSFPSRIPFSNNAIRHS